MVRSWWEQDFLWDFLWKQGFFSADLHGKQVFLPFLAHWSMGTQTGWGQLYLVWRVNLHTVPLLQLRLQSTGITWGQITGSWIHPIKIYILIQVHKYLLIGGKGPGNTGGATIISSGIESPEVFSASTSFSSISK